MELINNQQLKKLTEQLQDITNISIVTHLSPDGDAIGSSLGLYHFLKKMGKTVQIIVPNKYPRFLNWIPGCETITVYEDSKELVKEIIKGSELLFCLDFNALNRIGELEGVIRAASVKRVLIDHHPFPVLDDFSIHFSSTQVSSTAELAFEIILAIQGHNHIGTAAAAAFFTGIMTDTGSFSFACERARTFEVVAHLIENGISVEKIHRCVFDNYSESRMRLMGYSLGDKLTVLNQYHTAYIALSKEDLVNFNYKDGDTEGLVNYALSIEGVCLAVLFTEKKGKIRLSLRSKGDFAVNKLAQRHFSGGGHRNAAGGDSAESLEKTIEKFTGVLEEYSEQLSNCVNCIQYEIN